VDERERHLRGAHFVRVHAAGDGDDDLAAPEDLVPLARRGRAVPGIQLPFELPVLVDILIVSGALISRTTNELPLAVLPSSWKAHAVGARRDRLHVFEDLVHRASLLSAPTLNPINCSGDRDRAGRGEAPGSEHVAAATRAASKTTNRNAWRAVHQRRIG